ncbi:MAG TPA: ATP-dependent DNA helicase [Candidatus Peribacteraceae bacterium]|nr:ATP-dependent DNA helicase [Candidatus Peribacteraceae bacterium]
MPTFDQHFEKLNPEQRKAVEAIEGPVMVVAGPGTGKTQVLGMRVANILKKTQARPSEILCLTFSIAGATAMRDRLRQLIGADAYGVTVSTVHGFCDSIIRRNASAFSDWSLKKPLSDIDRYTMMRDIIDQLGADMALIHPKRPYDRIPDIISRISDCKREGKTLEDLQKVANEYDVEMAGKSRAGTKANTNNRLAAQKFREFIRIFARYQEMLEETETYDYDDMILTVLDVLNQEEWLLLNLQERYQYILVDEAQDLNGGQWKVIERLTTYDTVPHDPNFFLVGDDDQSIYRFQGANMEHMLRFCDRFPSAPVIVLTENYRSTQTILDAAGRLIAHNDERLIGRLPDLTKDLHAYTAEKGIEPILLRPPSDTAEPWLIADLCEERIVAGIPPEEIAVLVQTNRELKPIYDVLRARKLPVIMQGKADLLTHRVVSQALTILRCLLADTDRDFIHALACDCFGCNSADVARVISTALETKKGERDVLLSIETSEVSFADRECLLYARDTLFALVQKQTSRTVLETVEATLRESHLIPDGDDADPLDLAAIEAFFHYVKDLCLDRPMLTLKQFLHDLEWYADDSFAQLRLTYAVPHLVTSGIQLLTAHQSKGLEYHTVILSQFREGHWDERKSRASVAVPEELLFGWESERKRAEKHQDERRVAYVAMTRAKRELIMLCPHEFVVGERARPVAPSAYFAEAGPLPERDEQLKQPEEASLLLLHPKRDLNADVEAYVRSRLEHFELSPSSLSAFLDDPQAFLNHHLLYLPEKLTEESMRAMAYGNAVHWALKEWAGALQKKSPATIEKFLQDFEWNLRERNVLIPKEYDALVRLAHQTLPAYFTGRLQSQTPVIYAVERSYNARIAGGTTSAVSIPIKGKIDRIDLLSETSGDAIVIDFKTGKPKSQNAIRGNAEDGSVSRTADDGAYFRQLVFYALLLEQAEPLLHPQSFVIEFVGEREDEPVTRPFTISDAEKESLRRLIRDVWAKIQALDFTPL